MLTQSRELLNNILHSLQAFDSFQRRIDVLYDEWGMGDTQNHDARWDTKLGMCVGGV